MLDINENPHYVLNPWIQINEFEGSILVSDKLNGNEFEISSTLLNSAIESINRNDYNKKEIEILKSLLVIINKEFIGLFQNPILDKTHRIDGKEIKLHEIFQSNNINVLIGIPYDFSQTISRSAHYGSLAIRNAVQSSLKIYSLDNTYDLGDILFFFQEGLVVLKNKLNFILQAFVNSSNIPIILGGDHSITY